jgi:hypothetical protein
MKSGHAPPSSPGRWQWLESWFWFNVSGRDPLRTVGETSLDPGVYLFTSATCSTCAQARQTLQTELGGDRFHEFAWEEGSETFDQLGIDAVPAVLVVEPGGRGTIFPGQPDRALRRIDAGFDP